MKSDNELIRDFQAGNDAAFDDLTKRYLNTVYDYFLRVTNDEMEAEDLAQNVFLKLYKSLKKFRFEAEFKTYLYRVNLNHINSYFKKSRWRNLIHLEDQENLFHENDDYEKTWTRKQLYLEINALPKKQKSIVMMRIIQNLPYADISNILGISENSAKVNYYHAVQKLKKILGN
jgi:RNA polymerase sigma-70 factor (ECF subfamily)